MKLENGELSLLTFLVRYSTISSVYNMIYVWEEKRYVLQTICLTFYSLSRAIS